MFLVKNYIRTKLRSQFAYQTFPKYITGNVADIGAGGSADYFRKKLGKSYLAIDISDSRNTSDVHVNLEESKLPFKDREFDTVLCFDCLEHCDNIHELFDELSRISKKHVVISLPNNWPSFFTYMLIGRIKRKSYGYGLPTEPQNPGARHKWWFNMEEAERFVRYRAAKNGYTIAELRYIFEPGDHLIRLGGFYPNIMAVLPEHIEQLNNVPEEKLAYYGPWAMRAQRMSKKLGPKKTLLFFYASKVVLGYPIAVVDEVIKQLIWGWGSRYRYLNLFCRQLWVVMERSEVKPVK